MKPLPKDYYRFYSVSELRALDDLEHKLQHAADDPEHAPWQELFEEAAGICEYAVKMWRSYNPAYFD